MRKTTLSLVIGTLIASGAACAGNENGNESTYGMNDSSTLGLESEAVANTDLSVENIDQLGTSSAFAKLDVDGNGTVSQKEASAMAGLKAKLASLDEDGDGALSFNEFAALSANLDMDTKTDWSTQSSLSDVESEVGAITTGASAAVGTGLVSSDIETDTVLAANENMAAEVDSDYDMESKTDLSNTESAGSVALKVDAITETNVEQTFETVDANGDDAVDSTEATAITGLSNLFAQLDANADGELDYTEFQAVTSLNFDFGAGRS